MAFRNTPMDRRYSVATSPPPVQQTSIHDRQLQDWFKAVDSDGNGKLTTEELQNALLNDNMSQFNLETVRLMMNMFDRDQSGYIDIYEFVGLWRYIEKWRACFRNFDRDGSGSIDAGELKHALRTFGYNIGDRLIHTVILKYDRHGKGDITFDSFIQVCVTIHSLTSSFRNFDTDSDGWVYINYEQFLELVISNK
ncbi:hypothetical protein K7432_005602 [Basidiobolus ranarum]|uniref:EF-hand domain-containing protein n=1 Tax=Basidiobolus ranarum TaxID=34480 RepID=A0ABR2WWD7_9FUNG